MEMYQHLNIAKFILSINSIINVILAVKPLKNILSENLQPVFLRVLLNFYNGEYVIASDKVCVVDLGCIIKASGKSVISWCPIAQW